MVPDATTLSSGPDVSAETIAGLMAREERALESRTQGSRALHIRAARTMTGGVPSSYQAREPWPIYLTRGSGSRVWDVDGNEYSDFHNGYGSMVQGHAHPAIVRAVSERIPLGSHFAMPTEDSVVVSEELARRFGLPQWRFVNSGSEATMDAIRIARGVTGRDPIMKIFGSYHGHHDYVMVSIGAPYDDIGPPDRMNSLSYGAGIPQAVVDLTVAVPFNDAAAMQRRIEALEAEGRKPACVIMEAAMMNLGVVLPEPGYLQAVREITRRHGIVLIFDEVKTGLCVAAGGAVERFGVLPDMVTLAKALGGGLPTGAIGATEELMAVVASDKVKQVGTYNGNPLAMAAARANLLEVLTPEAYAHLDRLNDRLMAGCRDILARHGLAGYPVGISSKGCVHFTDAPIRDYTSFMAHQNAALPELAWLYNANRAVLMAPGREEEWTLSVQHTDADVDRYLDSLDAMAGDLARR
ncbi:aspartate aminotransferase family protein [Frankia sp. CcI49]|uniref:aspartate aminotransferase family protein n=1 Tax=unclassified Frankia TaxID=2632575 RepID=UPI0006CA439C|nr:MULTISPECIES: aspartate aminotransferase family protein [unclassified Frankia]KPM57386.1 glutamate-1-semialdehyde 2,1-aminomutase [Frankia sp. R43]ONH53556.1 aspartate aminotransferase family protein [Frankia sp. CcI49]